MALDLIAVVVDPIRACDRRFVALRRDRRPRPHVPDVLAEGLTVVAVVPDDPLGHAGQLVEQGSRVGHFMGLSRCQPEGDGATLSVGDRASLGAIATTRTAESFTSVSFDPRSTPLVIPAAFLRAWLTRHPRWTFHFTPTSASKLNAVEGFFSALTRRRLRRNSFTGVVDLQAAIKRYIAEHNRNAKPFVWTKPATDILAAVSRSPEPSV